jgi:PIN domain nuclease of toxin-antitoxin system
MEEKETNVIVVDSCALFWFVSENDKLNLRARQAILDASKVVVPIIVIFEIISLLEKYNALIRLPDFFGALYKKRFFIYPLDRRVLRKYLLVTKKLEMHDRIIIATAQLFRAPIVTRDKEIAAVYQDVIWQQ